VLATVLAAVALACGTEVSKTCSKFVSVSSSFDGSISMGGSENASGIGGVLGFSALVTSARIGGGNTAISDSGKTGRGAGATGSSTTISSVEATGGIFGGLGTGAGLLKILAQLRVPSGLELGLGGSAAGTSAASCALIFSQDDSIAFSASVG
jgi:hypothetical protein